MTLSEALGIAGDEVVALVGGGGKTTTMFRLAREIVDQGGSALTTTTTRIFAAQIAQAPAHVVATDATRETITDALARHRHVLVIGNMDDGDGRAAGVSPEIFAQIRAWCPGACVLNEADGSRMRPFKAPADHEPVIPVETTLVVPVVGADILGRPLDGEHVHRPELVTKLAGAPLGAVITPEIVARVLAHREGGLKNAPEQARIAVLINKVDTLADLGPVRETAERLLRQPAIESVVLAAVRATEPVIEVYKRRASR